MIYKPANTNRILMLVLFATLAFDLMGRGANDQQVFSVDLSSVESGAADSAYSECGRKIHNGVASDKEGHCELKFNQTGKTTVITEARVVKGAKVQQASRPTRPELKECKSLTGTAKIECDSDNARIERNYKAEIDRYNSTNQRDAEDITIEITSSVEGSDCIECRLSETVSSSTLSYKNANDYAIQIRKVAEAQYKKVREKNTAAEKLAKDIENCVKDDDGKALKGAARLECRIGKMDDMEETKAQRNAFRAIRSELRECIARCSEEEREEALGIAESLSQDNQIPTDLRGVARVMKVSGDFQSRVLSLTNDMALSGNDPQARMYGLQQLQQLQREMQMEISSAGGTAMGRQTEVAQELLFWRNNLGRSVQLAASRPQSLLDSSGYYGRERLDLDINQRNRTLRGIPGDPLVNTDSQFDSLLSSNERFINQQINAIQRSTQNQPFGANHYTPGGGQQQPQTLPGSGQQVGYQPVGNGLNNNNNTNNNTSTAPGSTRNRGRPY
jgi:hypothetical protein